MPRLFLSPIDMGKLEIQNQRVHNLASAPASPVTGQIYYDTATNKLFYWNGSSWIDTSGGTGVLASTFDAKGDLLAGTADNTYARLAAGADDTILMADAAQTTGLKWVASATPVTIGTTAAVGTADTFSRGDHVHDHELAHIQHDTTWAAKGDLIAATGNDAASVLTVGADDTILMADTAAATGLKWVAAGTPSTQAFGDSAVVGTSDTFTRGDHKHAMPAHGLSQHQELIATADLTDWPRVASLDLNSQKITSLLDPTGAQDAATKAYVDATAAGIDWKASVRAATTANITTLAGGAPNTLDGVTLAANDRILVKDQTTGSQNGIYTVTTLGTGANGTWTRATDADVSAEMTSGVAVFVEEGTVNADTGWVLTTNNPITLGTTALVFTQFTSLGQITAGAGLTKTGSTVDVIAGSTPGSGGPGGGLKVNADDVVIDTAIVVRKYAASFGDGAATSYNIDHNLGTLDVTVEVFRNSDGVKIECDVTHSTTNRVILAFAVAPTSNQHRAVIHG